MKEAAHYSKDFYTNQEQGALNSARLIVPILIDLINPKSVLDVGCGNGTWLEIFKENKISDYIGVDGEFANLDILRIPKENFFIADLKVGFTLNRKFDLAISLEVGEHLPNEIIPTFVASITKHADIVAFSAAIPGQGGTYHINEQPHAYWHKHFSDLGYECFDVIRPKVWYAGKVQLWYRQNIFLYVKKEKIASLSIKLSEQKFPDIHPETSFKRSGKTTIISQLLSNPKYVLNRFIFKRIN